MTTIDLSTASWTLHSTTDERSWPAAVPGCVHTDLLTAGEIPDPWFRDNEKDIHWVFERDWRYVATFSVDEDVCAQSVQNLICDGLDTLCTLSINGSVVLDADNMHRTWVVPLHNVLKPGENTGVTTKSIPLTG